MLIKTRKKKQFGKKRSKTKQNRKKVIFDLKWLSTQQTSNDDDVKNVLILTEKNWAFIKQREK